MKEFDIVCNIEVEETAEEKKENVDNQKNQVFEMQEIVEDKVFSEISLEKYSKEKGIIESILFASGKAIEIEVLSKSIDKDLIETEKILDLMINERKENFSGIEIINVNSKYLMHTKKEYAENIYEVFDDRKNPKLTNSSIEVLSIIAYNPNITRTMLEDIRGVSSDYILNRLIEYGLVEEKGKLDLPGKPMSYSTTDKFLFTFGINSLDELPDLPQISEKDLFV